MTRRIAVLLPLLVALGGLAPALPVAAAPTPVRTFTVDDGTNDPDATPGDGTCATATGRCTLQAAFDEAIALRKGTIVVTRAIGEPTIATVRGTITLRGDLDGLANLQLTVERGATVYAETVNLMDSSVTVRGRLVFERSVMISPERTRIDPSGRALFRNVLFLPEGVGLVNHGHLDVAYSTLLNGDFKLLQNAGAGTSTLLTSNIIGKRGKGRSCAGTRPTSLGYNLAYDGSCGLTHPTDLGLYTPRPSELGPEGTPRLDAIPIGEAGCGTTTPIPPQDGDGDGVAACDIGYREYVVR